MRVWSGVSPFPGPSAWLQCQMASILEVNSRRQDTLTMSPCPTKLTFVLHQLQENRYKL